MEKSKGEKTKERIIETAAEIFIKNGYNNTGIKEILEITKLPKGSFYFHFKSKNDLAKAVAEYFKEKIGEWLILIAKDKNWDEFIDKYTEDIRNSAKEGTYYGCPFAVIGSEISFVEPDIREYYAIPMKNLAMLFSTVLRYTGAKEESINELSRKAVVMAEGYMIYYRVTKDIKILDDMNKELKAIIK